MNCIGPRFDVTTLDITTLTPQLFAAPFNRTWTRVGGLRGDRHGWWRCIWNCAANDACDERFNRFHCLGVPVSQGGSCAVMRGLSPRTVFRDNAGPLFCWCSCELLMRLVVDRLQMC